ncbi:leukemia inhibitory factor receptor-like [Stigmatopora nigra]
MPAWWPQRRRWAVWLSCCFFSVLHAHVQNELRAPQQVTVTGNRQTQQISVSWRGSHASAFDVIILRPELNQTAFYVTGLSANESGGRQEWEWTSPEPLECTSLSVQIRSREGAATGAWSAPAVLPGNDVPAKGGFQFYPQDGVMAAGSNGTFCCVLAQGLRLGSIRYGSTLLEATRLSRRSYGVTVTRQPPSTTYGINVVCQDLHKSQVAGTVLFVGYAPLLTDLQCHTEDLVSATCRWKRARNTHLRGKRRTRFTLNHRECPETQFTDTEMESCASQVWEGNWTLEAVNPLGRFVLRDGAQMEHRVRPTPPLELSAEVSAWNATLRWSWEHAAYRSLSLVCQVQLGSGGNGTKRPFAGVGLRSARLLQLHPDRDYRVRVRCGARRNFFEWGNWSRSLSFKTHMDVPEAPDVWMRTDHDNSAHVVWKPLTARQSHGRLTSYQVTWRSPGEMAGGRTESVGPRTRTLPLHPARTDGSTRITATVVAKNAAGASPPATVVIPLGGPDQTVVAESRADATERGFALVWPERADCGYVLEWRDALCWRDCSVEWLRLATGSTEATVASGHFQPGVKYNISLFSCSSKPLRRWHGYVRELAPSGTVPHLSVSQQDSDAALTWGVMPEVGRRGYLLGYNVYLDNDPGVALLANLSGEGSRKYTVKGLSKGTYKFTVKAYTLAGEDVGATASITLRLLADWLILEILTSLGATALFLAMVTFLCYRKRKWVKGAFYPDIPQPKLNDDWSRTQGPLDVRASPNHLVRVVEKPQVDSFKEVLVVIPEEDEDEARQDDGVTTTTTTTTAATTAAHRQRPSSLRRHGTIDSSDSSADSGQMDVFYTGIQTSASSRLSPADVGRPASLAPAHGGGYRPQRQAAPPGEDRRDGEPEASPGGGREASPGGGGYKAQTAWRSDSPGEAEERPTSLGSPGEEERAAPPSLGSPASVASTQFLLPDGEAEQPGREKRPMSVSAAAAAGWFTNLLSSAKA